MATQELGPTDGLRYGARVATALACSASGEKKGGIGKGALEDIYSADFEK